MARHTPTSRAARAHATPYGHRLALAGALALLLAAGGCASDTGSSTGTVDPSRLFWALTIDHHAVTLSLVPPYDTFRIAATARTSTGAALSGAPNPHFRSTDADRVQVDSTGLLRAIKTGQRILVVAVDTVDEIVHADTVWVNVNNVANPPVLAALSIHPAPPDSAKLALGGTLFETGKDLAAQVTDADGNAIGGIAVHYESTDTLVATINPVTGTVFGVRVGEVKLIASATAYGVTRADTLPFTIGLPLVALVTVQTRVDAHGDTVPVFPASSTLIAVGGDVVFTNQTSLAVDVVFDDPTNVAQDDLLCDALGADAPDLYCSSGNIAAWSFSEDDPGFGLRYRQLRAPGTYHYHDSRSGARGTITVQHD